MNVFASDSKAASADDAACATEANETSTSAQRRFRMGAACADALHTQIPSSGSASLPTEREAVPLRAKTSLRHAREKPLHRERRELPAGPMHIEIESVRGPWQRDQ